MCGYQFNGRVARSFSVRCRVVRPLATEYCCRSFSVGFDVVTVSEAVPSGPGSFTKKSSGDFRCVSDLCFCTLCTVSSCCIHTHLSF